MRPWQRVLHRLTSGELMSRDELLWTRATLEREQQGDPSLRLGYLFQVVDARLHSMDTGLPYVEPPPPIPISEEQAERRIHLVYILVCVVIASLLVAGYLLLVPRLPTFARPGADEGAPTERGGCHRRLV